MNQVNMANCFLENAFIRMESLNELKRGMSFTIFE